MSSAVKKQAKKKSPLGRVTSLGPKEPWQAALLLPNDWDDLRYPIDNFNQEFSDGDIVLVRGFLNGEPKVSFKPGSAPRLSGSISDNNGYRIFFSVFGDSRDLQMQMEQNANNLFLVGQVSLFNGMTWLKNVEVPDPRWVGRIRPRYAGKTKVINPETVRDRVVGLLREAIPVAAQEISKELGKTPEDLAKFAGIPGIETLERVILHAHIPKTLEQGLAAQEALERMAAYRAIMLARSQAPNPNGKKVEYPRQIGDWSYWSKKLPFTLSPKQCEAIEEIVGDLKKPDPMRRLLSGDVGYGKTAVFAIAVASVYGAGGRVAILLPNETLAEQASREIKNFWPEVAGDLQLVTGGTDTAEDLTRYRILVGTTALLFRDVGEFHFVVVDEQQKFSRDQRESLLKVETHLLEATATCIPRSQALIQFGGFKSTILDEPPIPRDIKTVIRYAHDRGDLFKDVQKTLDEGSQVLVVYPRKSKGKDENEVGINDVEAAAEAWENLYPGDIRLAHSERSDVDNEQALKDMREEKAKVLIATTVVEVGVNIPKLRQVIIVHPHRFGLSTLHQIRGRAARTGGIGYCDLYLPDPPKEKSLERLYVLEKTQNGFEVAREDLIIRGCGDLSADSKSQTGSDETILFGRPLTPMRLEEAARQEENIWQ